MVIQEEKSEEQKRMARRYNYGVFFRMVLKGLGVQEIFYNEDFIIRKHLWYELCDYGRVNNKKIRFGILQEKTGIKMSILKGEERMLLKKDSVDAYSENDKVDSEDEDENDWIPIADEIKKISKEIKENNCHLTNNIKDKCNSEFIKLLEYAIFLTGKNRNLPEYKINECLRLIKDIKSSDYREVDPKLLKVYFGMLQNHIEVIKAVQLIKSFDNESWINELNK